MEEMEREAISHQMEHQQQESAEDAMWLEQEESNLVCPLAAAACRDNNKQTNKQTNKKQQ